ncbi:MAG: LicD family protein [Prevotellaceae bacterium]|nr:LicD family protein [Candidatus Minthosoma equi]
MRLINEANYDIRTLQNRLVPILECIDKVCKEHNLRYYLWAGTMLGAVRHKGFIPWDDDMDIAMPRKDYEVLLKHCAEWVPAPFEIIGPHNRPDYPYTFAKVEDSSTTVLERPDFLFPEGIYVDIFPIDGIVPEGSERKSLMRKYKRYRKMLFFRGRDPYKHGGGPKAWGGLLFNKMFSLKWILGKLNGIMLKYKYEDCEDVIDYDSVERGIVKKAYLGEPKLYEFEGKQFLGVADYDKYLTQFYGDYMTLPPKEKQIQHNFYYIDLDMPYREFVKQGRLEDFKLKR